MSNNLELLKEEITSINIESDEENCNREYYEKLEELAEKYGFVADCYEWDSEKICSKEGDCLFIVEL
ncbi:MAG: hypothetical protein ACRDD7_11070, partial [Peptostreptococcaceae bacterium]